MEISNNNFYSYNIDYFSRAKIQNEAIAKEQNVEEDTNALEKNEAFSNLKDDKEKENNPGQLSSSEKVEVYKLKAIDSQVRAHEAAHQSGPAASGGASYTYTKGPDGVMYAVAGEVPIQIETGSTPQETMSNMQDVIATALAPADPSPQDLSIASKARVLMMKAQQEYAKELQEKLLNDNEYEKNAKSEYEKNNDLKSKEEDTKTLSY